MTLFAWGMCSAASWASGLFFWKFFRTTRDPLFAKFALAFWTLSIHWLALAVVNPAVETRHYFYVLRLVAFLLIISAIIEKNRASATQKK